MKDLREVVQQCSLNHGAVLKVKPTDSRKFTPAFRVAGMFFTIEKKKNVLIVNVSILLLYHKTMNSAQSCRLSHAAHCSATTKP